MRLMQLLVISSLLAALGCGQDNKKKNTNSTQKPTVEDPKIQPESKDSVARAGAKGSPAAAEAKGKGKRQGEPKDHDEHEHGGLLEGLDGLQNILERLNIDLADLEMAFHEVEKTCAKESNTIPTVCDLLGKIPFFKTKTKPEPNARPGTKPPGISSQTR